MKGRIKELAYEAKLDSFFAWTSDRGNVLDYEHQKFAELIINDCIQALWTVEHEVSDLALEDFNRNRALIRKRLGLQ